LNQSSLVPPRCAHQVIPEPHYAIYRFVLTYVFYIRFLLPYESFKYAVAVRLEITYHEYCRMIRLKIYKGSKCTTTDRNNNDSRNVPIQTT